MYQKIDNLKFVMSPFFEHIRKHIDLTEEEEAIFLVNLKKRNYLKGQFLLQSGDICKYHSFILSGKVRSFYLDRNGNEHIITFGLENWWVSDLASFNTQAPADFNIQCLENTKVIQMSYEDQEQLIIKLPKLEHYFRILLQNAYINTQKRIIRNYSLTAFERYELFCKEYPEIVQRIPQYMIASYLGISKEFLSSIRSQTSKS